MLFPDLPKMSRTASAVMEKLSRVKACSRHIGGWKRKTFLMLERTRLNLTQLRKPQEDCWDGDVPGNKNVPTELHRTNRRLIHKPFFNSLFISTSGFSLLKNVLILIFVLPQPDY